MAPAEQRRAEGHEVRDAMLAIADQLVQNAGDKGERFGVVEAHTAGQPLLGLKAHLADDELVELNWVSALYSWSWKFCHYLFWSQLHVDDFTECS